MNNNMRFIDDEAMLLLLVVSVTFNASMGLTCHFQIFHDSRPPHGEALRDQCHQVHSKSDSTGNSVNVYALIDIISSA